MKEFDQAIWGHIHDSVREYLLDPAKLRTTWGHKISRTRWEIYWRFPYPDPYPTSLEELAAHQNWWHRVEGVLDRYVKWEGAVEHQPERLVFHVFTRYTGPPEPCAMFILELGDAVEFEASKYNAKRGASYHLQDIRYPSQVIGASPLDVQGPMRRTSDTGTPRRPS